METINRASMKERLARLVMAGVVAASVGAAPGLLPAQAWAATNGSVKIVATSANKQPNTYKVYQVFVAQGGIDANDKASQLKWNDSLKSAVLAYLNAHGYAAWLTANGHTGSGAAALPQNAAEFIAESIEKGPFDPADTTPPLTPAGTSFATGLAQALAAASPTVASYTAGDTFTNVEGFYLFVANDANVSVDEAATAPIWVGLGGSTDGKQIVEKNAIPTLKKEVKEDSDSAWSKAADANASQDLDYKLTGTMPDNIGAFKTYRYTFVDTLPDGMELAGGNTSSVVVKVGSTNVTADIANPKGAISYSGHVLKVDINDLLTLHNGLAITKDSVVTVEYKAHLTTSASMGSAGNENTSKLYYTKDPVSLVSGDPTKPDEGTTGKTTKTYTYQLRLNKVDKQTHENLEGAKFTVQVASSSSDNASRGKYVNNKGELVASAYTFTTDANGNFTVPRIDEGTYVIHEVSAPEAYQTSPDITLKLTSTLDQATGALSALTATVSGGEGEADKTISTDIITHVDGAPDVAQGMVKLQTPNDKKIVMPVTGMDGATATVVYGGGAVAAGLTGWYATRRRRGERGGQGAESEQRIG